ncbi:AsnC family transcriptional regulator [Sphingopyxis lindanitolerans]|uniref:AsnC family transcriptional regulator n=1 Tax=Sphingopyxis lindanitolerans TaxID=2054227 RepID=A0A2S8B0X4_9SPHN|nr:Lrp/AsnC family transcriptional regulator [Sphingopyxis lindanitolerans]PQM26044.1 AsnC family transcriptional regulator [Sphingopyxis lindanitolerans]
MTRDAIDDIDRKLLGLLRSNARLPTTSLAHALGISRGNTYARLARLERSRIIRGYTVQLGDEHDKGAVRAHVMIKLMPRHGRAVEARLSQLPELVALHAINGVFDLIGIIEAQSLVELNALIDRVGAIEGVENTTSSILLDTKIQR